MKTAEQQRRDEDWSALNGQVVDGESLPQVATSAPTVYRISKFLRVVLDASIPNQRCVISNHNQIIGIIGKYDPWNQWVLYPQPQTVWSHECLDAIRGELLKLNTPNKQCPP